MKKIFLKVTAATGLAFLLTAVFAQVWASAQNASGEKIKTENSAAKIVGVWDARITIRHCQTGAALQSFRSLLTFAAGGTMQETTAGSAPNLRSNGYGVWRQTGENSFSNSFKFFRFKADGSYDGWQKVRQQIGMSASGNEFSATSSIEIFDTDDKLIQTGCATATATRFE